MSEDKQGHHAHTKEAELLGGAQATRRIKVVMLGAGSGFTEPFMTDILNIPGLAGGELALVDIDVERLELAHQLIEKIVALMGKKESWSVTATPDRRKAFVGADYLVNCIEVSGTQAVRFDNDIPLKYGVDQCIGDTIGPGGLMKALRTIPTWIDVLKDAEEICPNALVLNYTNPMGMMILAASLTSSMQVVGLCHSVQGTSHLLAKHAEVPFAEMKWKCAGINHLAWFTELTHEGRDLYPILFEKARDPNSEFYRGDPIRCDMMLHFGAFITESSGHLSEYLPYYRKRKDLLEKYAAERLQGGERLLRQQLAQVAGRARPGAQGSHFGGAGDQNDAQLGVRQLDHRGAPDRKAFCHTRERDQPRPHRQPPSRAVRRGAGDDRPERFQSLPLRLTAAADGRGLPEQHVDDRARRHRGARKEPGGCSPRLDARPADLSGLFACRDQADD